MVNDVIDPWPLSLSSRTSPESNHLFNKLICALWIKDNRHIMIQSQSTKVSSYTSFTKNKFCPIKVITWYRMFDRYSEGWVSYSFFVCRKPSIHNSLKVWFIGPVVSYLFLIWPFRNKNYLWVMLFVRSEWNEEIVEICHWPFLLTLVPIG
jgi:hypothetical protein